MHTAEATHDESEAMPLQSCEAPGGRGRDGGRDWVSGQKKKQNNNNMGTSAIEEQGKTGLQGRHTESETGGEVLFFRLRGKAGGKSMRQMRKSGGPTKTLGSKEG